jgi:DNA-binding LacI/PurR family transcriptional regulator
LNSGIDRLRKYSELRFIFPPESEHPSSCIPFFIRFCKDKGLAHQLIRRPMQESDIEKGVAYLLAQHSEVVQLVKICRRKGWQLGKDVGLVTFNDAPMLEVIDNGISVISTDFKQMGQLAANYIKTRQRVQAYVPTRLIIRGSL